MKRCLCRAFVDDSSQVEPLRQDLKALGLTLNEIPHQVFVEFSDTALLEPVIDLFSQFYEYGYFVEF